MIIELNEYIMTLKKILKKLTKNLDKNPDEMFKKQYLDDLKNILEQKKNVITTEIKKNKDRKNRKLKIDKKIIKVQLKKVNKNISVLNDK